MATFITTADAILLEKADAASAKLGTIARNTTFEGDALDEGFIKTTKPVTIKKSDGSSDSRDGFLDFFDAQEILTSVVAMAAEDAAPFCALVTDAAREASTDRDYLLAVAYVLSSNLTTFGDAAGKAGPFRYNESEWAKATQTGAAANLGLLPEDRLRWYMQPRVAAFLAAQAAKDFKNEIGQPPKFKELFFVQLLGAGAIKIIKDTANDAVKTAIEAAGIELELAAKIKDASTTVDGVLDKLQALLKDAYDKARPVIDAQPPDIRLFRAHENDPPWMAIAREQMSAGVSEDANQRNTAQINAYFTAIGATPGPTTPWCGAFVGYCIKQCGVSEVASIVDAGAATTSFWETKGQAATKPFPVGSIVVLKPGGSGGHVGFLAEDSTDAVVRLLGGNQGSGQTGRDHVSIVNFPVATNQIVAVRVFAESAPIHTTPAADDTKFVQDAPAIMKRLRADIPGMAVHVAAAILGNIGHECRGFHDLHQIGRAPGEGGHGWCQWDGVRRDRFLAFAASRGGFKDPEANYLFLLFELKGTEKDNLAETMQQQTLERAVEVFDRKFERSGVPNWPSRKRYARLALQAFNAS